jgi:hypothetical protein
MGETKMLDLQRYDSDAPRPNGPAVNMLLLGGLDPLCGGLPSPDAELAAALAAQDIRCLALKNDASSESGRIAANWAKDAGMNIVSLAGMEGGALEETRALLGGAVTLGAGKAEAEAFAPYVRNINGVRIGVLAVSERLAGGFDGRADILHPLVCNRVHMLLAQCDHVVVLCHAGLAGTDLPLPEWRARFHRFVDAGASVVAVMSPGAVSGWEEYQNGLVFYGLGTVSADCETAASRSLAVLLTLRQNGRFQYEARVLGQQNGQIGFPGQTAWKDEINALNALFLDGTAYLERINALCRSTYEAWRKGANPRAMLGRSLFGALVPQANAKRENEARLCALLSNESLRLAVLRAIAAKQANEDGGRI